MFVLQTTLAILIAFLALTAYNTVQNRLAKGRARRKDVESPASPRIGATNDDKPPPDNEGPRTLATLEPDATVSKEMEWHKRLYFQLHSLEQYPDILPECFELLVSLLSEAIADASKDPNSGILSISKFSRADLGRFLKEKDIDVTNRYEAYIERRKTGGSREMFSDQEEAKWWLKQAAPVKYVDGAWLGHINKISTPFKYRHITKNAWQVMSEELGDGDLVKNHVHVYRELMKDIDAGLPLADSEDFIHPRHGLNEARCWKAAMAQLLVSLFPHDFLPEALGFNMAYESLPLHLLKTIKELRELKLNAYYFELHVCIDNADSGHAAMAMETVIEYIELVAREEGEDAAHVAWKRVQAGYLLAEALPTTPESPPLKSKQAAATPFPRNDTEKALVEVFAAKAPVAHKIHCNSRLKIGRRSLIDWLEPTAFADSQWQKDFLDDLSNCKPWVIKGDSEKSRLVKEMSWDGKMFGSFTQTEVEVLKLWIDMLDRPTEPTSTDPMVYFNFVGRPHTGLMVKERDVLVNYPVIEPVMSEPRLVDGSSYPPGSASSSPDILDIDIDSRNLNPNKFISLWFASCSLLDSLPSVPVRAADVFGSALIRVLRAQTGFNDEGPGVAGMDEVRRTDAGQAIGIVELGLEICDRLRLRHPENLKEVVSFGDAESMDFAKWVMGMSMRWLSHGDLLVGMAWMFMQMHMLVSESNVLLSPDGKQILKEIAQRERNGLEIFRVEICNDEKRSAEFRRGVDIARRAIMRCT